jgi:flagellar motility protein MotE (MotC chaperone)
MTKRRLLTPLFAVLAMVGAVAGQEENIATAGGPVDGQTLQGTDPTLEDQSPTIEFPANVPAPAAAQEVVAARCVRELVTEGAEGTTEAQPANDCVEIVDAPAMKVGPGGTLVPLDAADLSRPKLDLRLKERRLELDSREDELSLRGALLDAAERRLQESADELDRLLTAIKQANEDADSTVKAELQQLATIYQGMKPADAAAIFNQMPAGVLIPLMQAMPPKRLAPILARMRPDLASRLTVQLAATASATAGY